MGNIGNFSNFPVFKIVSKSIGFRGNTLLGELELKKWYNYNLPLQSREPFYSGIERLSDGKISISHLNSGTEFSKTLVY